MANGRDALEQIATKRFDAALIDAKLPDMEGTEILPSIQQTSPETVKIVFTGTPDTESLANGGNKNMDAFLVKPVKPEVFLDILDDKLQASKP